MDLSINICSYNNLKFLITCLTSVYRELKGIHFEIIVVDNGSRDMTVDVLKKNFPSVTLIENHENKGVARARNQSIRRSSGRLILFLDADVEFSTGNFLELINFMDSLPQIGLLGVKQVTSDDRPYPAARSFPGLKHIILRRLAFLNFFSNCKTLKTHHLSLKNLSEPVEVDYVIGAFQLVRKEALDIVGLLDEKMFYGFEDADFCARMRKAGYIVMYYPFFTIKHYVQGLTRKKLFSRIGIKLLFYNIKSYARFYIKHHDLLKGQSK
jgi:GT2 family glycosyltransferase